MENFTVVLQACHGALFFPKEEICPGIHLKSMKQFWKNYQPGTVVWGLIGFYGLFRFLVEFVREPDAQIGFDLGPFTRGQLLTIPMLVIGLWKLFICVRQGPQEAKAPSNKSRAHSK